MIRFAHLSFFQSLSPGIFNQLVYENLASTDNNLNWDVYIYCKDLNPSDKLSALDGKSYYKGHFSGLYNRINFLYRLYKIQVRYDLILLRYDPSNPFLFLFLYLFKSSRIFLVHHSIEIDEIRVSISKYKWFKYVLEKYFGPLSIKYADGVVAVTHEIGKYQSNRGKKKTYHVYPNGISYSKTYAIDDMKESIPEFIFIASYFSPWQGLDLLIDEVMKSGKTFKINIIGVVETKDLKRIKQDSRLVYHGSLDISQIRKIASKCSLGISSLALHRQNLKEACSLKVREYLAMGLPVIGNYVETIDESFPYYKNASPDIDVMLEFASQFSKTPREVISIDSHKFISKYMLMCKVISDLTDAI